MWGRSSPCTGRYPEALGALQERCWEKSQQNETLSALAVRRSELDDAGLDPREELAFQGQLDLFADKLRRQAVGSPRRGCPERLRISGAAEGAE
jgi:hypothetical protein